MKKLLLAIFLVLFLATVSVSGLAGQATIADLVVSDCQSYCCGLPLVSVQGVSCNGETIDIAVRGIPYSTETRMYVIVDGNQLIYSTRILWPGVHKAVVPSLYNDGHLRLGTNRLTIIVSSREIFKIPRAYSILNSENFLGYPCCGYVKVVQADVMVKFCCCCCCFCCAAEVSRGR